MQCAICFRVEEKAEQKTMTFSRPERIDVRHLTTHQPFSGGVLLSHHGKLVMSLISDTSSPNNPTGTYRVGIIAGGKQERGETIWEFVQRDAREKLGIAIDLQPSSQTYFHDIDSGEVYNVHCTDNIPPFLLERQSNLFPYTSSRPGLPSGPYTYFGSFLAHPQQDLLPPATSILAFLLLPLDLWPQLSQHATLQTLLQQGAEVVERQQLSRTYQILLHPNEPLEVAIPLLQKHPELLIA
jgi:hypothetical protein